MRRKEIYHSVSTQSATQAELYSDTTTQQVCLIITQSKDAHCDSFKNVCRIARPTITCLS